MQNMHFIDPSDPNMAAVSLALTEGVQLNNRGLELFRQGKYEKAYKCYKKALEIKREAYGDVSIHNCITLSGLADSLLRLGRLDEAYTEARLMLDIAKQIGSDEQIRIAREVLKDVSVARKVPLLPDEVAGAPTTTPKTLLSKVGSSTHVHVEPPTKRCHNFSSPSFVCPNADNLKACARCKTVFYCSRDCQVADWKTHKRSCHPASS